MAKYNAIRTKIDGIVFDSKKEARRYQFLLIAQAEGRIKDLETQPKFVLMSGFRYIKKAQRAITYSADFRYKVGDITVIEDVKSPATSKIPVYRAKAKLFLKKYGRRNLFREVYKACDPIPSKYELHDFRLYSRDPEHFVPQVKISRKAG